MKLSEGDFNKGISTRPSLHDLHAHLKTLQTPLDNLQMMANFVFTNYALTDPQFQQ